MANVKKTCSYSECNCPVDEATEYCSASCATAASGKMEGACHCGHAGCAASSSQSSSEGRPATMTGKSY